jgi:hypothetical protein
MGRNTAGDGGGDIQKGKRTGPYNKGAGEEKNVREALGEPRKSDKIILKCIRRSKNKRR